MTPLVPDQEMPATDPESVVDPASVLLSSGPSMTAKVVTGSLWTFLGQAAPLGVSFLTTPIFIRLLGSETYGLWALVGLIPLYLAFADFGMGMGSTRFAAKAYGEGDAAKEAAVVRAASVIGLLSALPFAIAIAAFAAPLAKLLNVTDTLMAEAVTVFRLASLIFVINILNTIVNSPQLSRLRMDLNALIGAVPKILAQLAAPLVVYMGYGVTGAVCVLLAASVISLLLHLAVSTHLLKELKQFSLESWIFKRLLAFGGFLWISGLAGALLSNSDKFVLTNLTSLQTLSHYSVAFIVAMTATFFSGAMLQSLIPAFAQLMAPAKRPQLELLFQRALRLNIIVALPILTSMAILADSAFTLWAGEEFGRYSVPPFRILLIGVFFNLCAYPPLTLLIANGKTGFFAKLYWGEVVPYLALLVVLTYYFGASGAALAWTIRVIIDAGLIGWFSHRTVQVSFHLFGSNTRQFIYAIGILLIVALVSIFSIQIGKVMLPFGLCIYAWIAWRGLFSSDEKEWFWSNIPFARG